MVTEPAADMTPSERMVWIESIISAQGRFAMRSSCSMIRSEAGRQAVHQPAGADWREAGEYGLSKPLCGVPASVSDMR